MPNDQLTEILDQLRIMNRRLLALEGDTAMIRDAYLQQGGRLSLVEQRLERSIDSFTPLPRGNR